jgi:hypothetical protein
MVRISFLLLALVAAYVLDTAAALSGDIQSHFTLRTGAAQSQVRRPTHSELQSTKVTMEESQLSETQCLHSKDMY